VKTPQILALLAVLCVIVYYLGYAPQIKPNAEEMNYVPFNETPAPTIEPYTGQDMWKIINDYRKESGVPELKLSEELCNGISTRWQKATAEMTHDGFEEFIAVQRKRRAYSRTMGNVMELIGGGDTPQIVLDSFKSSPSHNMGLLSKKMNEGCVYAWDYKTLILLGQRLK